MLKTTNYLKQSLNIFNRLFKAYRHHVDQLLRDRLAISKHPDQHRLAQGLYESAQRLLIHLRGQDGEPGAPERLEEDDGVVDGCVELIVALLTPRF